MNITSWKCKARGEGFAGSHDRKVIGSIDNFQASFAMSQLALIIEQ